MLILYIYIYNSFYGYRKKEFSNIELYKLDKFFIRGGWILDIGGQEKLKDFTISSIGIDIKEKYGPSQGKSFLSFLKDNKISISKKYKLLNDLLEYYDNSILKEHDKSDQNYISLLDEIKLIVNLKKVINNEFEEFAFKNSDTNLRTKIDNLLSSVNDDVDHSLTLAKSLIEETLKTINYNEQYFDINKNLSFNDLLNKTLKFLNLDNSNDKIDLNVKKIISSFYNILNCINEIRNMKSDSHGRLPGFQSISKPYSLLIAYSSITICNFLINIYFDSKKG